MYFSNQLPIDHLEQAMATVLASNQDLSDLEFDLAVQEQCFLLNGCTTPDHYWDCEPEFPCTSHR